MKIRSKLLILLLLIAVLPLLIASVSDMVRSKKFGRTLAEDRRRILTDNAHELMQSLVESHGRLLDRDQQMLEHAVRLQAHEVQRRLADAEPMATRIYFSADFATDSTHPLPPGTRPSTTHTRPNAKGQRTPIPVTYDHQVFFVVDGIDPAAIEESMRRLSTMTEVYQYVHSLHPEKMYWQYTSLEVGFHTSYPGHGGYPDDYDPRVRPWYQKAKEAGEVTWILLPEVSTRTVSLTVAAPVMSPDGRFAGVTAIDVPLVSLFSQLELPQRWAESADALLIGPGDAVGLEDSTAVVLARQSYNPADEELDWRQPLTPERFEPDDPSQLTKIMSEAAAGRAGVQRIMIDGEPYLVAYGTGRGFPVVKVPEVVMLAEVEQARQRVLDETIRTQWITGCTLLVLIGAVVFIALRASRSVTRPARQLADAAQRLSDGDYDARVEVKGKDELAELGAVFNEVGPHLREFENTKHALAVAMEVQRNLLPDRTPMVQGFDIAGHSTYCDETGGDYYDYLDLIDLDDHSVAVVVGDVMGHGVAAAMLMATARGILKSRCSAPGSLAELMNHLNHLLEKDTGGTRFMTMLLLTLDAQTNTLRWASAGHDMPFIYDPSADEHIPLDGAGLPLGILDTEVYEEYSFDGMKPGMTLFAATDGVWEMKGDGPHAGTMFGKERVRTLLREYPDITAEQLSEKLQEQLKAFRGELAQDDDVTFVIVRQTGNA